LLYHLNKMLKKLLRQLLKPILTNTGPKLYLKKKISLKIPILNNITLKSFGIKNKEKIFYVIRRSPGAGLFSNVTFVLNHLKIAEKFKFTPVVDMENFPSIYNEKKAIYGSLNSWNYYFKSINQYTLKEVYESKNVIFTDNFFAKAMLTSYDMSAKKEFSTIIKKYIFIKSNIQNEINFYKKKYFRKSDKVLGVHFRGTTYKVARGHAFPIPKKLMIKNIDNLIKKFNYNKIFIVTEEENYLDHLKEHYKEKLIFLDFFRTSKKDAFFCYPRQNHRYKLGKEILIETFLLSCCTGMTFVKSNVSSAAIAFSKKKQNLHPLFIGYNSRNKYIAKWKWYFIKMLPSWMGGFKI
jgi:hypothetical protein